MPVFFQHRFSHSQLIVWRMEEPESFFGEALPAGIIQSAPEHPTRRKEYLGARFLLKYEVPTFPFEQLRIHESRRPFLADSSWQFSLSHSGDFVAAILDPVQPVGIDVERVSERILKVQNKFLSQHEQQLLEHFFQSQDSISTVEYLTLAWSIKEAAYKALQQTGLDFIQDLPMLGIEATDSGWDVKMGGKGSSLFLHAKCWGQLCLAMCRG